ncbi:MAG: molybdopterin dehydrogenase, partial [Bacillota bacterium]|nr:molybdopterin dehydrogenase [Bacillota bacterium]
LALDAWVSILGDQGLRRVSFAQMQSEQGVGLQENELITEIDLPLGETEAKTEVETEAETVAVAVSGFAKVGSRTAVTIARLNMAAKLKVDLNDGRIRGARWAVGALGPVPFHLVELEESLIGRNVTQDLAGEVAERLAEAVDRAIPGRYSQGYKRQAIQGLGYDLLSDLFPEQMANSLWTGKGK